MRWSSFPRCCMIALVLLPGCGIIPQSYDLSDYFTVRDYSWSPVIPLLDYGTRADIFVRSGNGELKYVGSMVGKNWYDPYDPGVIRSPIACSQDGRSIVWAHDPKIAGDRSTKEAGIYQYVFGEGDRLIHAGVAAQLGSLPKPLPSNMLVTYGRHITLVTAEGEIFPMVLLGATRLHKAAFEGNEASIVALLAAGHGVNDENYWGQTPLELALIARSEEATAQLLRNGAQATVEGFSPLHRAATYNDTSMLEVLLDAGADPNVVDPDGRTPLHDAVFQHRVPSSIRSLPAWRGWIGDRHPESAETRMIASLDMLIAHGADVDARDANGWTALHYVVRCHDQADALSAFSVLFAHGADPNARDVEGRTALHLAIEYFTSLRIVQALMRHGADANAADNRGNTPLHLVNNRIVPSFHVYWDTSWERQGRPALEMLISQTVEIDHLNSDGLSPLHAAVQRSMIWPAELLIANGADDSVKYRPVEPRNAGYVGRDTQSKWSRRTVREQIQKVKQSPRWIERYVDDPLPIDAAGNTPKDVAEGFLGAVDAGEFKKAESYWVDNTAERLSPMFESFESFCTGSWGGFERVELTRPRKWQEGEFRMAAEGYVGDRVKARWMRFRLVDGRWRLVW